MANRYDHIKQASWKVNNHKNDGIKDMCQNFSTL